MEIKEKEMNLEEELRIKQKEFWIEEERRMQEPKIAPSGAYISLRNINKVYDNHVQAVYDFNLDIQKHELIVFVGPSGCGKSTTLRMIAGLEEITTGDLFIDGEYCNEKTSKERDIAMVFQNYALYPHMTVYENMAFGLEVRKFTKEEIDERVKRAAEILQITPYLDRRPKELSGGQMQRVALGRAIVREAKVFLMDEPLSNLDAKLRVSMRSEIIKLHKKIKTTTIYVTHDQTEAMTMATRIVVMKDGYVQQIGTPIEIYDHPANTFVATFIGSPAMNLINCTYDNGVITFGDNYKITLSEEQIKMHDDFYKNQINNIKMKIDNKEYENIDLNAILTYHEEKFSLKNIIKKDKKPLTLKTKEEKLQELQEELLKYERCLKESHNIIFGIRPEDIYENIEVPSTVTKSTDLSLKISVLELLGKEYHIHMNLFKNDLIATCKVHKLFEENETFNFVFDLSKMHLFDDNSKKSIF